MKNKSVWIGVGLALAVAAITLVIAGKHGFFRSEPTAATVKEWSLEDVTDPNVQTQITEDAVTPGYYTYDVDNGTLVLLTFGETQGLRMRVTPHIEDRSVYFRVGFDDISESGPHTEFRLFWTDAEQIGGDEAYLKFPGYGVGASGYNTGWCERNEDGSVYLIPLDETRIIDRIAVPDAGVDMGHGLYRYEYVVTSSGVQIKSAQKKETYPVWCALRNINEETNSCELLVDDEQVVLPIHFDPEALPTVQQMMENPAKQRVIVADMDGVAMISLNSGGEEPENAK